MLAIRKKGYEICHFSEKKIEPNTNEAIIEHTFEAKKDGRFFSGCSPEELLGLISLWETRGDNWKDCSQEEWEFYEQLEEESKIFDGNGKDVTND